MGQAAYLKKVKVSIDRVTWLDVPATSPSLDFAGDTLDDTTLATATGSNSGYRNKLVGLLDWSVNCDSNYVTSSSALTMIRNSLFARSVLYVQYLPEGVVSGGFTGEVVVSNFNLSGDVGSLETVAITLQGKGPLSDAV